MRGAPSRCCLCLLVLWCGPGDSSVDATVQVNGDGTASVTGEVEENYKGCARDGICYFKLKSGKSEIRVLYDPGETDAQLPNRSQVPQLLKVDPGTIITAYGSHRERGSLHTIDAYSKKEYFIHILRNQR
jgi:hypothetical protein